MWIASKCAASFGAIVDCKRCSVSFVFACVIAWNALFARVRSRPVFSSATMVLSNVGADESAATFATSAICARIPSTSAGS